MKSGFVSTVSHQLRAPLTSIYGFAETLLRHDVDFSDEERRTFLQYVASESERLTAIVDTLVNVARLEAGDLQVELAPTDLHAIVSDVVASADAAALNGHEFVLELPDEPLAAQADDEKLRQVLVNLVDNAVKYSPAGGRVVISARPKSEAGTVEVAVTDEGVGIPQAEHELIFSKFYRRADLGMQEGMGAGLGLFIAEGLVSAMGGSMRVSSIEGEGSSFAFELPLVQSSRTAEAALVTRVLVVDDDAPIRLLCRVNLEAEGMEVLEAADGASGLEKARSARPDVVLLDVMLPKLDGWRVAEALLEDPETGEIPIVFLTARAELRDQAHGLEIGGVEYITKPFNPVELADVIRELLERVRRGEQTSLRREKLARLRSLTNGL